VPAAGQRKDHYGHRPPLALSEVPEALRYLGEGHAKGKVVVTIG
jgi:NADPH-dependent curcumin reductase CurA